MGTPDQRCSEWVVLVVDDEEMVCRYTARVLTDAGFRVLEVHDGEEAVTLLATVGAGVWLVISDITMPRMTGTALAALMAARWPAVPVLLISGKGGPPGGYDGRFLRKPFTPGDLVAAVRLLLPAVPAPTKCAG